MNHVAVVVDHFFVSLLVLDVILNGRLLDFVDPRLLSLHQRLAEMNVEVFAHAISIFHHFVSDLSVQLMAVVQPMVMNDSYLGILRLISHHQILEYPLVDIAVSVELLLEEMFAHAIWTVTVTPLPVVKNHHRHHSQGSTQVEARGCEGLRGTGSREFFLGPTLSLSPASDGAGGHPGGIPEEPVGS